MVRYTCMLRRHQRRGCFTPHRKHRDDASPIPAAEPRDDDDGDRPTSKSPLVDSRKTAEAIMKRLAPELYQALVDAGELSD